MNKRRYILTQWEEVIPGEYEIVTHCCFRGLAETPYADHVWCIVNPRLFGGGEGHDERAENCPLVELPEKDVFNPTKLPGHFMEEVDETYKNMSLIEKCRAVNLLLGKSVLDLNEETEEENG